MYKSTVKDLIKIELVRFRSGFQSKVVIIMPVIFMILLPFIAKIDIENVSVCVVDNDHSGFSERLAEKIDVSKSFNLSSAENTYEKAMQRVEAGKADIIMTIPQSFEKDIVSGNPVVIDIASSAVSSNKGGQGSAYLNNLVSEYTAELAQEMGVSIKAPVSVTIQNKYNPALNYRIYRVPGVRSMLILMIILCGLSSFLDIKRNKVVFPDPRISAELSRSRRVVAKLVVYSIAGLIVLAIGLVAEWLIFGLVPSGSYVSVFLAALLFIITMIGLGQVIANYSVKLSEAVLLMLFIRLVNLLMSGLITPVSSMPAWEQVLSYLIPSRYLVDIIRGVFLKGSTFAELWISFVALLLLGIVFNIWAALGYRKKEAVIVMNDTIIA